MAGEQVVPNFFIAGAPKCGTTALSEYLCAHPNVYMCYPKEPSFFADDLPPFRAVTTLSEYEALFRRRSIDHLAVGEASVWYIYSQYAMDRIRAFNPDAKIILMFRNPIDFLQSLHTHFLFDFNEDQTEFIEAWNLQDARREGRHRPEKCVVPQFLQYKAVASFSRYVEHVLTLFPRDQVKCVIFENFVSNSRAVYLDILDFLGVPDDGRVSFPKINEAKSHRWQRLARQAKAFRKYENGRSHSRSKIHSNKCRWEEGN